LSDASSSSAEILESACSELLDCRDETEIGPQSFVVTAWLSNPVAQNEINETTTVTRQA
jgi:hypothetical protein